VSFVSPRDRPVAYPSGHFDAMWLFNDKFERVLAKFEEIKGWKQ
jgi:hypothetical protein